jgi:hemerythrin-like domain-containing protein
MAAAIEMAAVHNVLIRGLNSIYLQAPHIHQPADIADLLLYISSWGSVVHHHHALEERLFFPVIDALAKEKGVEENLMNANIDQHHLFEPKFEETLVWVKEVKEGRQKFDAKVLLELIDGFAPVLTQHLHDEIDTLMKLEKLDGVKVKQALDAIGKEGAKTADPVRASDMFLKG